MVRLSILYLFSCVDRLQFTNLSGSLSPNSWLDIDRLVLATGRSWYFQMLLVWKGSLKDRLNMSIPDGCFVLPCSPCDQHLSLWLLSKKTQNRPMMRRLDSRGIFSLWLGGQIVSTATRLSGDVSTQYILCWPTDFVFWNILGCRFLTPHRSLLY